MPMACIQCVYSTADDTATVCPQCGSRLQFSLVQRAAGTYALPTETWKEEAVLHYTETVNQPLGIRIAQVAMGVLAYLIATYIGAQFAGILAGGVFQKSGEAAAIQHGAKILFFLPAVGFLFAGAIAGATTTTWFQQGTTVACVLLFFHLPIASMVSEKHQLAICASIGLGLLTAPLGAYLGQLAMGPPKIFRKVDDEPAALKG